MNGIKTYIGQTCYSLKILQCTMAVLLILSYIHSTFKLNVSFVFASFMQYIFSLFCLYKS
jgi:hypothetical protein